MPHDANDDLLAKLDRKERSQLLSQWALVGVVAIAAGALSYAGLRLGAGLEDRTSVDIGFIVACGLSIALARSKGLL
jgi:hypothetical protein